MSIMLEFAMTPLDKGESVSPYVARSLDIIDRSGVPYVLTPMGTVLEGEWDEVMAVVQACYDRMSQDCIRVSVSMKLDCRAGRTNGLKSKIAKVKDVLQRPITSTLADD